MHTDTAVLCSRPFLRQHQTLCNLSLHTTPRSDILMRTSSMYNLEPRLPCWPCCWCGLVELPVASCAPTTLSGCWRVTKAPL